MVRFVPIDNKDFQKWRDASVAEYISERIRAGNDDERSPGHAEIEFSALLPQGRFTENNHVCTILDEKDLDRKVGVIWYAWNSLNFPRNTVFLYDIHIDDELRGRGYGRSALLLLEEKTRELGKERIALHVFAHNERARRLYEELGFKPTNIVMAKQL